jgi:predicted ATPase
MFLATYRPEELVIEKEAHPLATTMQRMNREKLYEELTLKRLTEEQTNNMVNSIFGTPNIPQKLSNYIVSETEGNPLYIEEVLKSLIEDELITQDESTGKWDFDSKKIANIPTTIKDIILTRINRLESDARKVLEWGSIIGPVFPLDIMLQLGELEEDIVLESLERTTNARLIYEELLESEVVYKFNHSKIQEVIYSELSLARKMRMHCRVGEVIEELNADDVDSIVYELVRHFSVCGESKKLLHYGLMAAEKATVSYALDEAKSYYTICDSIVDDKSSSNAANIYLKQSQVTFLEGNWDESYKWSEKALAAYQALEVKDQDLAKTAECFRQLAEVETRRVENEKAEEHYEKALALSEKAEDVHGIGDAYFGMGSVWLKRGKYETVLEYLVKSLKFANEGESKLQLIKIYNEFGIVYREMGKLDQAIEYYQKCIDLAEEMNDLYNAVKAYNNLGTIYYDREQWEQSAKYFEKCIDISKDINYKRGLCYGLNNLSQVYAQLNQLDKALRQCDQAIEIATKINEEFMIAGVYSSYGNIYKTQRDWKKAIENFNKSVEIFERLGIQYYLAYTEFEIGLMYKEKGDDALMHKYLKSALAKFKKLGSEDAMKRVENALKNGPG